MELKELGFTLIESGELGGFPYETWEKVYAGGYEAYELRFDTRHGGKWTVECAYRWFQRNDDPNVFVPMGFNPSTDWCGDKGFWYMRDIPCIDTRLAEAIWHQLAYLDGQRPWKEASEE